MKYITMMLLFFFSCQTELATPPKKEMSQEVSELLRIADDFENTIIDSALHYSKKALSISRENQDIIGEIKSLNNIGYALTEIGQGEEGYQNHQEALRIAQEIKDSTLIGQTYNFLGVHFNSYSDYNTALEYFLEALKIHETKGNLLSKAVVLGNIGLNYFRLEKYDLAEKYMKQTTSIDSTLNDTLYLIGDYLNLGLVYKHTDRKDLAIQTNLKSWELAKKMRDKMGETRAMNNLGRIYFEQGAFEKAEELLLDSKKIRDSLNSPFNNLWMQVCLMDLYQEWGQYEKSLHHSLNAHNLNESIQNKDLQARIYRSQSASYEQLHDYKQALEFKELEREIIDSMNTEKSLNSLASTEVKLNVLEKQNQIFRLENEQLVAERKRQRMLAFFLAVAGLLAGIIYFLFQGRQRDHLENERIKTELIEAITRVDSLSEELDKFKKKEKNVFEDYDFSLREIEIVELLIAGKSNKEVADQLYISINTVKYHIKNIYKKLDITSRKEVVMRFK